MSAVCKMADKTLRITCLLVAITLFCQIQAGIALKYCNENNLQLAPYNVFIEKYSEIQVEGVILNNQWILTIGSFVGIFNISTPNVIQYSEYRVGYGSRGYDQPKDAALFAEIENIYVPTRSYADTIALVKLKNEIPSHSYNNKQSVHYSAPVKLPCSEKGNAKCNKELTGKSAGVSFFAWIGSENCLEVENATIVEKESCRSEPSKGTPPSSLLCANFSQRPFDGQCTRRPGIPLVIDGTLVGIANTKQSYYCDASTKNTFAFVDIVPYLPWIEKKTGISAKSGASSIFVLGSTLTSQLLLIIISLRTASLIVPF